MTYRILTIMGALAAIAGGAPRVISSFIPYSEGALGLELFYGMIDVFLLFGLFAVYLKSAEQLGWSGLISFLVAAIGLAGIVGPDPKLWGVDLYQLGSTVLMVGLSGLAAVMLWNRVLKQAALYWLAAFAVGILATLIDSSLTFAVAGMLFGVGFVSAGVALVLELEDAQTSPTNAKTAQ